MPAVSILSGPLLWTSELSDTPEQFTLGLDVQECAEVKHALTQFQAKGLGFDAISPETFPLPKLASRLTQASQDLHKGRGFFIVKDLNIDSLNSEDLTVVHLGISSYIGDKQGVQNKNGDVMIHVTDAKHWTVPQNERHGIHSQKSLPFHNDMGSDILSLQARASAKSGGSTYLASAWSIYNDLAANQPEALHALLSDTWPIQVSGASKHIKAPLMQLHDDKLVTSVDPARLGPQPGSIVPEGEEPVPELTPEQQAALNALGESAKKHEIQVTLQKGDMLFLNNWAIIHRRDAYEDGKDTSRHLVRLWIRNSELGWKIPKAMAMPWEQAFEHNSKKVYNIEPAKEYIKPQFTAGSAAFVIEDC